MWQDSHISELYTNHILTVFVSFVGNAAPMLVNRDCSVSYDVGQNH